MYSIFNTKSNKLPYLEEGEPPPKKLVTEADTLIKTLAKAQLRTDISLAEQLNQRKEFTSSETFTNITAYVSGKTDLNNFKLTVDKINALDKLKSKGLSDRDVELYKDYMSLGADFWQKYKDLNKDVLQQHLQDILQVINGVDNFSDGEPTSSTSRHMEDYLNSLKPCSVETKLLKFASKNESKQIQLPSAIDVLPDLEKQFMEDLEEFSRCDVKKIRKKARSLGNKISELSHPNMKSDVNVGNNNCNLNRKTLWDMTEIPADHAKKGAVIEKHKKYTCEPQNWYTIKEGKIIKLHGKNVPAPAATIISDKQLKLTVEEIRLLPKFSNYEPGTPSGTLFLKNLSKDIDEAFLKSVLADAQLGVYSVKIMSGRMRGQAFIAFEGEKQSRDALEILNGVLAGGKPIIAQFGKKKV